MYSMSIFARVIHPAAAILCQNFLQENSSTLGASRAFQALWRCLTSITVIVRDSFEFAQALTIVEGNRADEHGVEIIPQISSDDARDVALEVRCPQPASSRRKIVAYEGR